MEPSEMIALAGGIAGLITALGGVLLSLVKIRQQREETASKLRQAKRENAAEARKEASSQIDLALESLTAVNGELRQHMAEQSRRITDQGRQITDQGERITDITRRHRAAVRHLIERERAIHDHWDGRPSTVPEIPDSLIADLLQADPHLRIIQHTRPKIPDPDDDEPRIRDPT